MKRIVPPLLALLVGGLSLAMTFGLWAHERQSEQARLRAIFDFDLRQIVSRIEQRIASYEQMLRSAQGHFQTAGHVDRVSFDRYVDSVMAGPEAAGLRGLGYGPLLTADQLPAYVAARRAEGFSDFAVHPPGPRDLYSPLTYLAPPRPENAGAFGYDGLADPVRRTTMMQARDSGNIGITRRLRLTIDSSRMGSAYLMYLPLYRPGSAPATVAARREDAVGWLAASFRIGDLMSALNGEENLGLVLQLHDGADTSEASVTYRSGASSAIASAPARFAALEPLKIAGYVWTLQLSSLPEFERRHGQDAANVILVAGLVLSTLTALLTFQLLTGRARATATAQAMTHELSKSEARYRRIVETAGEGIWLCDAAQHILFTNARLARWLGWPEGEMLGRPIADFMDAEQAEQCLRALDAAAREDGLSIELRLRRRDGNETWVAASMRPIVDDAGQPTGSLAMFTDINERHLAEERRNALEAQLREAQKMEAIGTLAGGIAHDFNNILAAILGNVAVARQDAAAGVARDTNLAQIERSAARARALVQQILTFSRIQAQELQTLELQPLIEETIEMLRAAMPARVELVAMLPTTPIRVRADATQMQQVMMNLCTNAWHALPAGCGRIEIGADIEHDLEGDAHAHLWVADNGSGMDAATRARVFEPFFTTKAVGHGTGLGLAVVHGIVRTHGGTIQVESTPGAGTRFDLHFPLQLAPGPESAAPAPEAAAPRGRGEHVLCIDDDPAMVMMTETLLQRAGYHVTVFEHPLAALAAARANPCEFDVVVSDFNMPEMSGMELAQALALVAPRLPVVVTSGFISDEMRQRAAELHVTLLQKEYTLERLTGLVHAVLASAPARA